jgi:hypothetical protein
VVVVRPFFEMDFQTVFFQKRGKNLSQERENGEKRRTKIVR